VINFGNRGKLYYIVLTGPPPDPLAAYLVQYIREEINFMPKIYPAGMYVILIAVIVAAAFLTGCPQSKPQGQTDQTGVTEDGQSASDDDVSESTSPSEDTTLSAGSSEVLGNPNYIQGTVTEEEIPGIEEIFGVVAFPEAQLNEETSMVQKFAEGTEIYRLGFNTTSPIETVVAWYKEHMEAGTEVGQLQLPVGTQVYSFSYKSPDGLMTKNITVQGFSAEARCDIGVNLIRAVEPDEKTESVNE